MSTYIAKIHSGDYGGNFKKENFVKIQNNALYWGEKRNTPNLHKQLELTLSDGKFFIWHVIDKEVEILVTLRKDTNKLLMVGIERKFGESMQLTWGAEEG